MTYPCPSPIGLHIGTSLHAREADCHTDLRRRSTASLGL